MKAAGCRIYLLSNAQADFTNPEIDLVGLRELSMPFYLSSDAGIRKPQLEFLWKWWKNTSWTLRKRSWWGMTYDRCRRGPKYRDGEYLDQYLPILWCWTAREESSRCARDSRHSRIAGRLKNMIYVGRPSRLLFSWKCYSRAGFVKFSLSWYTMKVNLNKEIKMNNLPNCPKCNSEYVYEDGALLVCPECAYEWNPAEVEEEGGCRSDWRQREQIGWWRYGDPDQRLRVKGAPKDLKQGTRVKNIRIVEGDHNIDCKIDGFGAMKLKSEFVKKI